MHASALLKKFESTLAQCSICEERYDRVLRKPMIICGNHHTICHSCLQGQKTKENPRCPFCREDLRQKKELINIYIFDLLPGQDDESSKRESRGESVQFKKQGWQKSYEKDEKKRSTSLKKRRNSSSNIDDSHKNMVGQVYARSGSLHSSVEQKGKFKQLDEALPQRKKLKKIVTNQLLQQKKIGKRSEIQKKEKVKPEVNEERLRQEAIKKIEPKPVFVEYLSSSDYEDEIIRVEAKVEVKPQFNEYRAEANYYDSSDFSQVEAKSPSYLRDGKKPVQNSYIDDSSDYSYVQEKKIELKKGDNGGKQKVNGQSRNVKNNEVNAKSMNLIEVRQNSVLEIEAQEGRKKEKLIKSCENNEASQNVDLHKYLIDENDDVPPQNKRQKKIQMIGRLINSGSLDEQKGPQVGQCCCQLI